MHLTIRLNGCYSFGLPRAASIVQTQTIEIQRFNIMEDLQFEDRMSWLTQLTVSNFKASFIDPVGLNVDDELRFELLFESQNEKTPGNAEVY